MRVKLRDIHFLKMEVQLKGIIPTESLRNLLFNSIYSVDIWRHKPIVRCCRNKILFPTKILAQILAHDGHRIINGLPWVKHIDLVNFSVFLKILWNKKLNFLIAQLRALQISLGSIRRSNDSLHVLASNVILLLVSFYRKLKVCVKIEFVKIYGFQLVHRPPVSAYF